ncbi:MAG: Gfo/Idh/MocA family oxidoreductase [Treponema sp.]|jgi:predicted dehydrogenase|nr:Gfo/Idh/MocA family oxidoreductase [Treponema sp.]
MNQIPAAIIGLGRIASLLEDDPLREKPCTHAGAITANEDCTLVAGSDVDAERRALFAKKWQVPVYADAAEMLCAHHPQILVIATHPDSHAEYCLLAAENHIPVVICEKPLADSLRSAKAIARLTAGKGGASDGLKIVTNHERRYSEDYITAKTVLDEGRLGKLLGVTGTLYMGRFRRLLDVLWHDGTHLADAIMFLTDSTLKHRRSWGTKLTAKEGTAYLEAELYGAAAKRIPVLIEVGAGRDHLVFEIEFSCEKGRLRIGNGIFEVWESAESPYAEGFRSLKNSSVKFEGPTGYFANMVKDTVACVREPDRQPQSSSADGLRVIEYLHSIKRWR